MTMHALKYLALAAKKNRVLSISFIHTLLEGLAGLSSRNGRALCMVCVFRVYNVYNPYVLHCAGVS